MIYWAKYAAYFHYDKESKVKKLFAVLAPLALSLTACANMGGLTGTNGATSTNGTQPSAAQQLGGASLKIAINAKCTTELNNQSAWQVATKLMSADQKQQVQSNICGCVSEKAPENISAVDLATAALDQQARTTIVTNAVSKTINACVAEALH